MKFEVDVESDQGLYESDHAAWGAWTALCECGQLLTGEGELLDVLAAHVTTHYDGRKSA